MQVFLNITLLSVVLGVISCSTNKPTHQDSSKLLPAPLSVLKSMKETSLVSSDTRLRSTDSGLQQVQYQFSKTNDVGRFVVDNLLENNVVYAHTSMESKQVVRDIGFTNFVFSFDGIPVSEGSSDHDFELVFNTEQHSFLLLSIATISEEDNIPIKFSWETSSNISTNSFEYNLYLGLRSRDYVRVVPVSSDELEDRLGNILHTVGLTPYTKYYAALTAVSTNGLESEFSEEIQFETKE